MPCRRAERPLDPLYHALQTEERTAMELFEREQSLAQLDEHLRQAAAGHGRLVLVGGEAGVGKSALVDTFARGAETAVLRMSCDALSTPAPLGPVRDLAPLLGLTIDDRSHDSFARERLFRDVLAALAARQDPIVLVGEDAHWADGATLELFRFLGRRIGEHRALLVVTYRDDEIGADHPLRLLLGDLVTASTVHRMSVHPLSEKAVQQLADGSGHDAATLHRLTGGNPFFVTEVLATESTSVPASVGDAVLARAARLSPEARAVLDVAAVIGSTIDPDLLLRVAGPVLGEVDEGIARGLLRGTGDALAFRHELAREAVFAAVALPRRRMLHARVLAALRETLPSTGWRYEGEQSEAERDLAQLAHHAEAAGDRSAVLEFAIAAAEQATALNAHREAAAQYARALRFADRLPPADQAELLEGRSIACYLSDQGHDAIIARQSALQIWRQLGNRLREGDNLRWLSRLYWFGARGAEAHDTGAEAIAVLEQLPPGPELAMAYSTMSQGRMIADEPEAAITWGQRAIDLAQRLDEQETLIHAMVNVGTARVNAGDQQGVAELERSFALAYEAGFIDHAARALTNLARSAIGSMQLDEGMRRLDIAMGYAIEHDLENNRWILMASRAVAYVHSGAWDEALDDARQVVRRSVSSPLARYMALEALGRILARRGDPEAGSVLDEALTLAERSVPVIRLGPVRAARAEAAVLQGDRERALGEAEGARDLVFTHGNAWLRGELAWLLWRAGAPDVPNDGIAEPYALQIAGDAVGAAAAWQALGCPYEEARALAESDDAAVVLRAVPIFEGLGARPAAVQTIARLRTLGVRDLPTLRRGPQAATRAHPAGLTPREVEVMKLLAQGLRNAEIAERLYLTPKTVGHHVSAILAKLDVKTRIEAVQAAAKLGILPA